MQLSTTRLSAWKRSLKKVRILFRDPPPRTKELVFEDYDLRFPEIGFTYRVGKVRYESVVRFNLPMEMLTRLSREEHHSLFVSLGLSFATGHFLLSDFASVRCNCAKLDQRDIELLEGRFQELLTEFRYLAGLDPSRPVSVVSSGEVPLRCLSVYQCAVRRGDAVGAQAEDRG